MQDDVQRRIRRLFGMVIIAFLALIGWQSYWHLAKSDWLLDQPSNKRLERAERNIPRGVIFDRAGTRLAWTEGGERRYADARATASVLGYFSRKYGRTGVEGRWDLELAGLSRRFTAAELERIRRNERPRGQDLVLTLDLGLQRAALAALGSRRGAVVALDPATGGILAMATHPGFDPRRIEEDYPQLVDDDAGALRNRAAQDLYPPGSTMKLVTAAAALMHGLDEETSFTCRGKSRAFGVNITDYHSAVHGTLAMPAALAKSCNNYFARLAVKTGPAGFSATAEAFGFGKRWWDELPDRRMLPVPVAFSALARPGEAIVDGELAHMGFGQSTVVATPLQMAMVPAAIANAGTTMAPYLVSEVRKGGTDQVVAQYRSRPIGYPLDSASARRLAKMMRGVVTRGTATGADVRGITVYGKTGTAQQRGGQDHAWFIGFADRKRADGLVDMLAFAVVIERGGTGGRVAVPIARQLLGYWARR